VDSEIGLDESLDEEEKGPAGEKEMRLSLRFLDGVEVEVAEDVLCVEEAALGLRATMGGFGLSGGGVAGEAEEVAAIEGRRVAGLFGIVGGGPTPPAPLLPGSANAPSPIFTPAPGLAVLPGNNATISSLDDRGLLGVIGLLSPSNPPFNVIRGELGAVKLVEGEPFSTLGSMRSGRPSNEEVEEIRGRAPGLYEEGEEEEVGGTPRPGRPTPPKGRFGRVDRLEEEEVLLIDRARVGLAGEGEETARVAGFGAGSAGSGEGVAEAAAEAFSCRAAMRALIIARERQV
jgi:hypothetical protein